MYSVKKDLVLDPFSGLGTTTLAAMAAGRSSVGYEIEPALKAACGRETTRIIATASQLTGQRLADHIEFILQRVEHGKPVKHQNRPYGFPVITAQEKELLFSEPVEVLQNRENVTTVEYSNEPRAEFRKDWTAVLQKTDQNQIAKKTKKRTSSPGNRQRSLF